MPYMHGVNVSAIWTLSLLLRLAWNQLQKEFGLCVRVKPDFTAISLIGKHWKSSGSYRYLGLK